MSEDYQNCSVPYCVP